MKAITTYSYGKDHDELGTVVHEIDESAPYEVDETILLKKGRKYTILSAQGCSCWEGDYEGWTELTKPELIKMAKKWAEQSYPTGEKAMGEWILKNV